MIICVDFDGVIVDEDDRSYSDVTSPLVMKPGVREGLAALKRAGHLLVLYSGRSNRARMYLPEFDPLVRKGFIVPHHSADLHAARYRHMLSFVTRELPGLFDAIDDGRQGKPVADVYVDDRAVRFGGPGGMSWDELADLYGE
jgi:hypothetical protein